MIYDYMRLRMKYWVNKLLKFEMIGTLIIGKNFRNTHFRLRNKDDYEQYFNATDDGSDFKDPIFNGYFSKINAPVFKMNN